MNTAFVVQGTLFLTGAVLVARASRGNGTSAGFIGCAAANAIGNVVIAAVPSGPSGIPWVHVSAAVLAIVGGNVAVLAGTPLVDATDAPRRYRVVSRALAALGLTSFVLLATASTTGAGVGLPPAVWERTSVYTIIAWQVISSLRLLARR
jgi:uncharacterized protein DUF998